MTTIHHKPNRKKHLPALLVALGMTGLIGVLMLALGVNAFFSRGIPNAQAASSSVETVNVDSLSNEELQALVEQYQARETQYLSELTQAADQLDQANAQVQQYQTLIGELQSMGVIQINSAGQVTVMSPVFGGFRQHEENEGFFDHD